METNVDIIPGMKLYRFRDIVTEHPLALFNAMEERGWIKLQHNGGMAVIISYLYEIEGIYKYKYEGKDLDNIKELFICDVVCK